MLGRATDLGRRIGLATAGLLFIAIAAASPAGAAMVTIDFESETPGYHFSGYESQHANGVFFSSTETRSGDIRDYLNIDNFGQGSFGTGLAISSGNPRLGAGLIIDFATATNFLSLAFGNDDPSSTSTGLKAVVLTLFHGGTQVGQSNVDPNNNGIIDQTIAFTGAFFDRAELFFIDDFDFAAEVNPIVDNVTFANHSAPTNVPAPGGMVLLALGLCAMTRLRRSR